MIFNKKGHIDIRNFLGIWSFFKFCIDLCIILGGGVALFQIPSGGLFNIAFVLWAWSVFKTIVDGPMVILWLIGKIQKWRHNVKKDIEVV